VGWLDNGGSYVTLVEAVDSHDQAIGNYSIVLETNTQNNSLCVRANPESHWYVTAQNVTLDVSHLPTPADGKLALWRSVLYDHERGEFNDESQYLLHETDVTIVDGLVNITMEPDSVVTLTTLTTGYKKIVTPPASKPFPLPFTPDFTHGQIDHMAPYFSDLGGSFAFETQDENHSNTVLAQQVEKNPALTGTAWHVFQDAAPLSLVGDYVQIDSKVTARARITGDVASYNPSAPFVGIGTRLGGNLTTSGCASPREQKCAHLTDGNVYQSGYWLLVGGGSATKPFFGDANVTIGTLGWSLFVGNQSVAAGPISDIYQNQAAVQTHEVGDWYDLALTTTGPNIQAYVNDHLVAEVTDYQWSQGWSGIGSNFHKAQFISFSLA